MGTVAILVPDMGDLKDLSVIELLVKPGDLVSKEQSLITVESDKASMEIPSSHAGEVINVRVKLGDKVSHGSVILDLLDVNESLSDIHGTSSQVNSLHSEPIPLPPEIETITLSNPQNKRENLLNSSPVSHASPLIRQLAKEFGIPLQQVQGSGKGGRIVRADLARFTREYIASETQPSKSYGEEMRHGVSAWINNIPVWPQTDFAKFGPIRTESLGRVKKISAAVLTRNALMIPSVTHHDDADITNLEAYRQDYNRNRHNDEPKLSLLPFVVKATVLALQKFPSLNSSILDETIVYKDYWNIGIAVDTNEGLWVPVIHGAQVQSIKELAKKIEVLSAKARSSSLMANELTGASFTISNLGGAGGKYFTPIINAPEVAILGLSTAYLQPVWTGSGFEPRLMLPISLSWDHRAIDGVMASRFNQYLKYLLSDVRNMLL